MGDKSFAFALLPKGSLSPPAAPACAHRGGPLAAVRARLARLLDLVDLSRVRSVSAWHRAFADRYLPALWWERLEQSYPVLALTMRVRRKVAGWGKDKGHRRSLPSGGREA